ncbi:family 20 glycosylhydrolase [Clostridium tarantellae]|uniref:Family 20 glycosylhydrolase n=1 Tax=Clostridium tarantellae TaxID=39493 RepID=A0A6I1MJB9_9CLOT|nr:family 20 glycosylhydrolase [Clostridium tarantellae]MPQ43485.1 family 20 glycosylhydrolase [Clostridium tarantellae]
MSIDINTIMNTLTVPIVNKGDKKLKMPIVPSEYTIEFIGADLKQIIDKDMNIYEPLIDTTVLVAFKIKQNNNFIDTKDIEILIPGKYAKSISENNKKPDVVPDLREWVGGTGVFIPSNISRIVIDSNYENELTNIANKFKRDYEEIVGSDLKIVSGNPKVGDFYFTLYCDDEIIGKEGYYIYIRDYIRIEAISKNGLFYGTKSILQIIKQKDNIIPKGIIRDFPKYEIRGLMLDVAKNFFPIEDLIKIFDIMAWYKLNDLHIHLNDNLLDINEDNWKNVYSSFRLESENYPEITAKDGYYSKDELRRLIKLGKEYGIEVVAEINLLSNALSFVKYNPDLSLGSGELINYLDVSNPEIYGFIDILLKEYLSGEDPILGHNSFHIGANNYYDHKEYIESFRGCINYYLKQLRDEYGVTPRLWGSLSKYLGETSIINENVIMNIYNLQYSDVNEMLKQGYEIINTLEDLLYIDSVAKAYNDYLNIEYLYNNWSVNDFKNYKILEANSGLKGATFAFWNSEAKEGVNDFDIYYRILPAMQIITEKTWTGKVSRDFESFQNICKSIVEVPGVNLFFDDNKTLSTSNEILQNYYVYKGNLGNGAKIDSNNFVSFIGGIDKGYVEVLVNVKDSGKYNLNISYLSPDIDRIFRVDINGVSTGLIYNAVKTNGIIEKLNLTLNLILGDNKIKFYGDSSEYSPSLGSFTLESIATDSFTFLDVSNNEVAMVELNMDSKNLKINISDYENYLRWGNLLEFNKIKKDNIIPKYNLTSAILSNGAKIDLNTGIVNGIGGKDDGAATVTLSVSESTKYNMELSYSNLDTESKVITADVNGTNIGINYTMYPNKYGKINISIFLNEGNNIIKLHGDGQNYAASLINFTLSKKVLSDYDEAKKLLLGSEEFNIVFVGNSITHGAWHTKGHRSFAEHFNERIRGEYVGKYLKKNNFTINTGVSSAVTTDILNYFHRRIAVYNPKIVIILIGMNDCANNMVPLTQYKINVKTLINKIRGIGAIPVLQTCNTINPIGSRGSLPQYMDAVREISISEELPLIDHYKYWIEQQAKDSTTQSKWLSDAIHPSAEGHLAMAKKIFEYFDLLDSNSYTSNMSYPINVPRDLGRYVDTVVYPKYNIQGIEPLVSYMVNKEFTGVEYIDKTEDLRKLKALSKGTIVARFKLSTSENAKTIFSISDSKADASNATLAINSGAIHFSVRNNGVLTTNITTSKIGYNDGNWHIVVADVSDKGTKIYVDGVNIHTEASKGFFNLVTSADTIGIGRNLDSKPAGEWYYKGTISYVNIYDNNLIEDEIISLSKFPLINYKIDRQFMDSEYIEKTEDLSKLKTLSKGTIVARFNLTTFENAKTIFSISDSKVDASNATLAINSGAIHFSVRNNGIITTNITTSKKGYNDGRWHTVVVNVSDMEIKIYVDGVNIHTEASKGFFSLVTSADTVSIGRNLDSKPEGEWYYKGAISYINIYDNNLTESECISISNENALKNLTDISNIIASNDEGAWIFVGNNVTAGKSTTYGHRSYVEHVEERIRWELNNGSMTRREKFMINMSSKDITSVDILNDFNNLIGRFNPKVVFLMVGDNEEISALSFKNNLNNIISKIKELNAVVVLQTPIFNGKDLDEYINVLEEIANYQKILLIDHYDYWFKLQQTQPELRDSWLNSNLEVNHRGQLEIAKKILKDLNIFSSSSITCSFTISTPGDNLEKSKNELAIKIKEAYSLYNNSKEGTSIGEFQIGSKKDLLNTIKQCEKLQNNITADVIMLTQSRRNLQLAINEYIERKI